MARFLCLGLNADSELTTLVVTDHTNSALPFGDHQAILEQMDEVDELTAIIELPDGDFVPMVVDPVGDTEAKLNYYEHGTGTNAVGAGGPDAGITEDDEVDNTAKNNG